MEKIFEVLLISITLALGGCMQPPVTPEPDPRPTVKLLASMSLGNGSAVVVAPGLLLTARHVADEIESGNTLFVEPQHLKVEVLRKNKESDLALLSAPGVECPCVALADVEPVVNDILTVVGYPMNEIVKYQISTQGKLQGIGEDKYTHTIHAAPGNSGGGVFKNGKLVGILVEGLRDFNYLTRSIRLKVIKEFLNG